MFSHTLRLGFRGLRRNPGYVLLSVGTLAVGLGASTAAFSAVHGLLLRPLPVERPDRLVVLQAMSTTAPGTSRGVPYELYQRLSEADTGLSHVLARMSAPVALAWDGGAMRATVAFLSPDAFETLGVRPMLGQTLADGSSGDGVVISHRLWRNRFESDPGLVGQTVTVGGLTFTVTGVAPAAFTGLVVGLEIDAWLPLESFPVVYHQPPGFSNVPVMGRLAPGVSSDQATARLAVVVDAWRSSGGDSASEAEWSTIVLRPGGRGFPGRLTEPLRPAMGLLVAACLCVWLIATVNAAGLGVVRTSRRSREVGIHLALGAGRAGLARQFLAESVLLAGLGGGAGWLLATQVVGTLPDLMSTWAGVNLRPDPLVLGIAMALTVATAVLVTLIQVLAVGRSSITALLTGLTGGLRPGAFGPARLVVIAQVALAVPLVAGALLFAETLENLLAVDLGYESGHVLQVEVEPLSVGYSREQARAYHAQLLARLRATPGIVDAALDNAGALSDSGAISDVRTPEGDRRINAVLVGDRYFETLRIPTLGGRVFESSDHEAGARVVVVNERLALELYGSVARAVGQPLIQAPNYARIIVGVVANTVYDDLRNRSEPIGYFPRAQMARQLMLHVATAGDPVAMVPTITAVARDVDPRVPVLRVRTLSELKGLRAQNERLVTLSLTALGWLALGLSALGLYGLVSFAVVTRRRDVGIRTALGARWRHLVGPFLNATARTLAIGGGIGIVAALAVSGLVGSQLYGVSPTSLATHLAALALLVVVSAVAIAIPLRRAVRVDPVTVLRAE